MQGEKDADRREGEDKFVIYTTPTFIKINMLFLKALII